MTSHASLDDPEEGDTSLFKQPETRAITQDQLVNEVKGIYAGLVMVEKKCVEIDQQQAQTKNSLSPDQWQALTALHRTLLHEHHDFFLASQHPSASLALKKLATKYAMPARMWRHGIHSYLELLRHRLPDSLDFMLTFVYLAYSMVALLMESVPAFLETWIECLGDLARYRMAIEEVDLRDREVWSGVARMWYNKAADKSPNVGRIQHHLAVLARPNIIQQLFYYSKSLVSVIPFYNTRESIMLLFSPFLENPEIASQKYAPIELDFVRAHGILFTKGPTAEYNTLMDHFTIGLDAHIARTSARFRSQGTEIICSLIAAAFDFGNIHSTLLHFFVEEYDRQRPSQEEPEDTKGHEKQKVQLEFSVESSKTRVDRMKERFAAMSTSVPYVSRPLHSLADPTTPDASFSGSHDASASPLYFIGKVVSTVSQRIGDKSILPFMHVYLAWLWSLAHVPNAIEYVERFVPWEKLVTFLNTLGRSGVADVNITREEFPPSTSGTGRQLPEDFTMRGLVWAQLYHPPGFFEGNVVDEDERTLELPSHAAPRTERCLWLGFRLASVSCLSTFHYVSNFWTASTVVVVRCK